MSHVLIVGAGPAGCSAALTLRLRGVDVTVLYASGGALEKAKRVDNYPGLPQTAGGDMLHNFRVGGGRDDCLRCGLAGGRNWTRGTH